MKTFVCLACLLALTLGNGFGTLPAWGEWPPLLIINEDNDHYFKQAPERMTEEALRSYIDTFANSQVTHFFMCPQGQRTSYRSAVHEAIWDPVGGVAPTNIWCVNCKLLFDKGIDPYQVWTDQCRKRKISPWLTMRMNDVHFVSTPGYFRNTTFWRSRRDLWRNPQTTSNDWMECAFDYSKKEAYDYHLAVVRELFERYDVDGFETDWLRFPFHLTPGKAFEQREVLTRFMRDVRAIAKAWESKRGHAIKISARVAAHPDAAAGLGTDAVDWAREGLVDLIVASCFFSSADFNIPLELWQERLGRLAKNTPVVPGIDNGLAPYPGAPRQDLDLGLYYGWAEACRYRGATSFYLFNLVYFPSDRPPFRTLLEKGLGVEVLQNSARRHAVTYHDAGPKGFPSGAQLPKDTATPVIVTIQTGGRPRSGTVIVIIGLSEKTAVKEASFTATLNGTQAASCAEADKPKTYGGTTVRALRYAMPLTALRDGANTVVIEPQAGMPPQQIVWTEIEIAPNVAMQ